MKIVYTVATYYPHHDGVQNVTQKQAEMLAALGHEVIVICGSQNITLKEELKKGVKILRIKAQNKFIFHFGDKSSFLQFVKQECSNADALISVCMESFATNWLLNELKVLKCNKILYLHGIANFEQLSVMKLGIIGFLFRMFKRTYWKCYYALHWSKIEQYDAIIHIHEKDGSLDYVQSKGYHNNFVIYNAVERTLFEPAETQIEETYITNISNYLKNKNQKTLLKYFFKAYIPYGLILIGSINNNYYNQLVKYQKKLAHKYGDRNVKLLYQIERDETVEYIKNANAVVMTSKTEKFPLTILEAMAAGKPFISSDVGVVSFLPGGIIYHNTNDLVQALRKLATDKELGISLGREGRIYASKYLTTERHISEMLNVLNTVISATGGKNVS